MVAYLMMLNQFKQILLIYRSVLLVLIAGFINVALANPVESALLTNNQIKLAEYDGQLKLDVMQTNLQTALNQIAKIQGFPIHVSELPDNLTSITCTGTELRQLLECLLDNKADLIVRYKPINPKKHSRPEIAEAWVVPATVGNDKNNAESQTAIGTTRQENLPPVPPINNDGNGHVKTDELLDKAQSNDKQQKAAALGALLAAGHKGDPTVRAVLEQALADQDPEVRAQAVSGLAHRDGGDALFAVEQGLQDNSEDVRLIAVEGIKDDITLLQQAINDSDEAVRSLAEIKLQLLMDKNQSDNAYQQ
ncbi:hypothetical protein MCAMS1_00499 [biofilm metagenome]